MYSRAFLILVVAVMSVGCAHWRRETGPPAAILERHPNRILVTRKDSSQTVMVDALLDDSTIVGLRGSIRGRTYRNDTLSVPLGDIVELATWYGGFEPLVYVGFVVLPLAYFFVVSRAGT